MSKVRDFFFRIDLPENENDNDHDNHDRADNENKIQNFSFKSSHASLGLIGQLCNSAKDGPVPGGYNHAGASP